MTTVSGPDQPVGGTTMQVDTGEFHALRAEIARLAAEVGRLTDREVDADLFFEAGLAAGEARTRDELVGKATRTSKAAKVRHLRAVNGDAS